MATQPSRVHARGQAIVEFALVAPIGMALLMGSAEVAIRGVHYGLAQHAADNLATVAALSAPDGPTAAVEADEAARAGCDTYSGTLTWPDGGQAPGMRAAYALSCSFVSLAGAQTIETSSTAVVAYVAPSPSPSVSAAP